MLIDKNVLDVKKAGIELLKEDEIFVLVKDTLNYWISNHGRLVSYNHKKYKLHKYDGKTNIHYTLMCDANGEKYYNDTYAEKLVVEAFLERIAGKSRIYHIDGKKGNCYYKNLIYVDNDEYYKLSKGIITIADLGRSQEYVPYVTVKNNKALLTYNAMYKRCYDSETKKLNPHYNDCTMYEGWRKDSELFTEWFESNYYEVVSETMEIDKDLLVMGNKEYAPDKCCILPQTINRMLSNCVKHQSGIRNKKYKDLPLGVRYDEHKNKYYGQIRMDNKLGGELINLNYWNTPEEAFNEYKIHKQAYILMMADKYKNYIPKKIYDALLKYEVMPFSGGENFIDDSREITQDS